MYRDNITGVHVNVYDHVTPKLLYSNVQCKPPQHKFALNRHLSES